MPIVLKEIEVLCNADKRKSANELPFVSAHMLHDLYLRANYSIANIREEFNVLYERSDRYDQNC